MTSIYHIHPDTLEPALCRSTKGKCPFGSTDEHFTSAEAARDAIENRMETFTPTTPKQAITLLEKIDILAPTTIGWLKEQKRWTKNEAKVLDLLVETVRTDRSSGREVTQPLMTRISGLHFAKEMLTERELVILGELETLQRRWF